MIRYTTGNLLEAPAEALVNTVNTVGVMGKGVALMFRERFDDNYRRYVAACKAGEVQVGRMFVTEPQELGGPRWIVNFPTKQDWRGKSRLEWVVEGLEDLRRFLVDERVRSVAVPPLGAGNGGLLWSSVRAEIEKALGDLEAVEVLVYEPSARYQNVAKRHGVTALTPARALIAELVRRYSVLGFECSLLEIQKLAWFLERSLDSMGLKNPLDLRFAADRYGPFAHRLSHLLSDLDGSYLHCDRRIADAGPLDAVWFEHTQRDRVLAYLGSGEALQYRGALEKTVEIIEGFESPYGMELLATVDWLLQRGGCEATVSSVRDGLARWPAGESHAARKLKLFDDSSVSLALQRLASVAHPVT